MNKSIEQEWISLNEFMRRNHLGYSTAIKLINTNKVEYEKIKGQYKIKVSKNEDVAQFTEKLIRRNEELETGLRIVQKTLRELQIC